MAIKLKKLILNISRGVKYTIFATNLIAIVLLVLSTKAQTVAPSHNVFISYLGNRINAISYLAIPQSLRYSGTSAGSLYQLELALLYQVYFF